MVYTIYNLLVGICANWYPISYIPTNKWYSPHHHWLKKNKNRIFLWFSGKIYNIFVLFFSAHSHIYLLINNTWSHCCTLQYCKVRWCGLYHLLLGICENGYPLAHIPTDKWYSVYTIAVYNTVKCDGVGCIIY